MVWEMLAILVPLMIFAIPIVAIITEHQRKLAELRMHAPQDRPWAASAVSAEVTEIRQQLTDLRDLTTKYDLSFDQALQRIEARATRLEERMSAIEQAAGAARVQDH